MFRFTIRDVLWLTALAAVLVAWWMDDSALRTRVKVQAKEAQNLKEAMSGGFIHTGSGGFPGGNFSGFSGGRP